MVCYGVIDPPEPPYILIFMASLQGIAFNVFWVSGDYDYNDERTHNPASRSCLYDFGGSHGSHRHRHKSHGHCYLGGRQRGEDIIIIVSLMMTKMTMTVVITHDPNIIRLVHFFLDC